MESSILFSLKHQEEKSWSLSITKYPLCYKPYSVRKLKREWKNFSYLDFGLLILCILGDVCRSCICSYQFELRWDFGLLIEWSSKFLTLGIPALYILKEYYSESSYDKPETPSRCQSLTKVD